MLNVFIFKCYFLGEQIALNTPFRRVLLTGTHLSDMLTEAMQIACQHIDAAEG